MEGKVFWHLVLPSAGAASPAPAPAAAAGAAPPDGTEASFSVPEIIIFHLNYVNDRENLLK